jgi:hypothetical protein
MELKTHPAEEIIPFFANPCLRMPTPVGSTSDDVILVTQAEGATATQAKRTEEMERLADLSAKLGQKNVQPPLSPSLLPASCVSLLPPHHYLTVSRSSPFRLQLPVTPCESLQLSHRVRQLTIVRLDTSSPPPFAAPGRAPFAPC